MTYLKKDEYDLAIKSLDQAIKLNPDYGRAFANRAGIYLKKGEYDRAGQDYDEAIRLEPNWRPMERAVLDTRCSRGIGSRAGGLQQGASVGARITPKPMTRVGWST